MLPLRRLVYAYTERLEQLTANQQRIFHILAADGAKAQPFAAASLKRYDLAVSSAYWAAEGPLLKDVFGRQGLDFVIGDRFVRLWIERLYVRIMYPVPAPRPAPGVSSGKGLEYQTLDG